MKLVEVVRGAGSSPEVLAACFKIAKRAGKVPVMTGNCLGFIGNRMMAQYGDQCVFLVEEGASPAQVDRALREKMGLAMGYFEMSDLTGNDLSWSIRKSSFQEKHDSKKRYPALADKVCEAGWLGQKTNKGWFSYEAGPRKPSESEDTMALIAQFRESSGAQPREIGDDEVVQRCMLSLVNEGFRILEQRVAGGPEDIDVVFTNGYGE